MTPPVKRDAETSALAETAAALAEAEEALKRAVMTHALRLPVQDRLVRTALRLRDMRQHVETAIAVRGER